MKFFFKIFIVSIIFLSAVTSASATVYYVAPGGSNASSGSNGWVNAWQTIGYAATNANSGDVVIVSNGNYAGNVRPQQDNVAYFSFQKRQAVLSGGFAGFYLNSKSQILIHGFVLKNATQAGVVVHGSSSNNIISQNEMFSNSSQGIQSDSPLANSIYILSNHIWSVDHNQGIHINNSDNIIIRSNQIHNNGGLGIFMQGDVTGHIIAQNSIYSNPTDGIVLNDETADNNIILSNCIFGPDQDNGIRMNGGDQNEIMSNNIYNHDDYGVNLTSDAMSNLILNNNVYSNVLRGISLGSDGCEHNIVSGNTVFGSNQNVGIYISQGDQNIIRGNHVYKNGSYGIHFNFMAVSNIISKNRVSSNATYGINFSHEDADNNTIVSNTIEGSGQRGIFIDNADNSGIYYNLIHRNQEVGIYIRNTATNNNIINNTVFNNISDDGIYWQGSASGNIVNNIIMSNGNGGTDYGIDSASTGTIYIGNNDLYGNADGPTNSTGASFSWGANNIFQDPLIDTTSTFEITTDSSPVVDKGAVVPGITVNYKGTAPDMGWKEWPTPDPAVTTTNTNIATVKIPDEDAAVYNNLLDLSTGQPAKIVFGKACSVEIKIYNIRRVLVASFNKQSYKAGESKDWYGTINKSTDKVGSGVYIVVITGDINKKLKILVKK